MTDEHEFTDAEMDASLEAVDRLANEIDEMFAGEEAANCVMALAAVFGRCVARFADTEQGIQERFADFAQLAAFELDAEHLRRMN